MMMSKVVVLVTDHDDPKHGEITVLDDQAKAERLIESLLGAGFEQERIRAFTGVENELRISYRPMVMLDADNPDGLGSSDPELAQGEPNSEEDSSGAGERMEVSSDPSP